MLAFIFDIDGCLTLPGYSKSILDISLVDRILKLYRSGIPVTLVTGRSDGWLKKHYHEQGRVVYLELPTYIEFGLVRLDQGEPHVVESAHQFQELHDKLITEFARVADQHDIYFEPDKAYHDFPPHGSAWLENKHIQISIASHHKVSPSMIHQLATEAWSKYQDQIRVLNHHLGVDVIPSGWSKARATQNFLNHTKINQEAYTWYVFGDNFSDREMCEGLDQVTFTDTKQHASTTVQKMLDLLL